MHSQISQSIPVMNGVCRFFSHPLSCVFAPNVLVVVAFGFHVVIGVFLGRERRAKCSRHEGNTSSSDDENLPPSLSLFFDHKEYNRHRPRTSWQGQLAPAGHSGVVA